jgi:hypothetical protein
MGFLKKLFGKKKGGSFLGNLVRKATGQSVPKANKSPVQVNPANGLANAILAGVTAGNVPPRSDLGNYLQSLLQTDEADAAIESAKSYVTGQYINPLIKKAAKGVAGNKAGNELVQGFAWAYVKEWFSKNWMWVVIIPVGGVLLWKAFRK